MLSLLRSHREALQLLAIVDLCFAVTYKGGDYALVPFILILFGIAMSVLALVAEERRARRNVWGIAAAGCAVSEVFAAFDWPAPAIALVIVAAAAVALAMLVDRRTYVVPLVIIAAGAVLTMATLGWTWGRADMDVFNSVQTASAALLHGRNPYGATFRGLVPLTATKAVWRPTHYQYGAAIPFLTAPGRLLGDVRIGSVAAFALLSGFASHLASQAADGRTRRWRILALCVAVPLAVGMIDNAWIDVYMLAGFAGWLALRRNHQCWAVICLAIALAVKPTILMALLVPVVWSHRARVETLVAGGLAAALTLPFVLATGVRDFYADSLGLVATNGPREDGLTLESYWHWTFGHSFPIWLSVGAAVVIAGVVLSRRPCTYSDVLGAAALITTTSFLLAKWAYYNYYFVPIWLLVLALAGGDRLFDAPEAHLPLLGRLQGAFLRVRPARRVSAPVAPAGRGAPASRGLRSLTL